MQHHLRWSHFFLFLGLGSSCLLFFGCRCSCRFFLGGDLRLGFRGLAFRDIGGLIGITPWVELDFRRAFLFGYGEARHAQILPFKQLGQWNDLFCFFNRMVYFHIELSFVFEFWGGLPGCWHLCRVDHSLRLMEHFRTKFLHWLPTNSDTTFHIILISMHSAWNCAPLLLRIFAFLTILCSKNEVFAIFIQYYRFWFGGCFCISACGCGYIDYRIGYIFVSAGFVR